VFAIQEGIARAITAALRMPLGLKPGENLVNNRAIDPESYEKYLRAKAIISSRNVERYAQAESLLTEVLAKNAEYAPALALGSVLYFLMSGRIAIADGSIEEARIRIDTIRGKGETIAQRAIRIDPNLASAYSAMAVFAWSRSKLLDAEQLFAKSLALDPVDFSGLAGYGLRLAQAGRLKEALGSMKRAHAVEPFHPVAARAMVTDLWLNGRDDDAIALAMTLRPDTRAPLLAMIYASMGRIEDSVSALMEIARDPKSDAAKAVRLLRTASATTAPPVEIPQLPLDFAFVNLQAGAPERVLDTFERSVDASFVGGAQASFVWHPSFGPVRKTQRFKTLMLKAGFVDYWRAKGWPEFCHPTTGDDFVCE
jgi:hypothetical protein